MDGESDMMTVIFQKIRKFNQTDQAVAELYDVLKAHQTKEAVDAFLGHYNRCSDAFRQFIDRRLAKTFDEDKQRPDGWMLPLPTQGPA